MIASWRGLAVAALIAVALALAIAVDLGRTRGAEDRALVRGFDADRVTELAWERVGQPAIRVVRAGDGWETLARPVTDADAVAHVPADPSTVGDVLAALRGARWHRRGGPMPVHATLTVVAGGGRHVLGIAAPITGTELTWIVDDDRGVVVDSWVARALDRDLLALRIKTPLADIHRARAIVIEDTTRDHAQLRITGSPRQLHAPELFVIAAELAGELERALGGVTIVRLPDGPSAAHGLVITTTGEDSPGGVRPSVRVVLGGTCPGAPGFVALSGSVGDGCVARAAVDAVEHAVDRLRQPPAAIAEPRPIPFEPARVVLADTTVLDVTALRAGDHPTEPARVAELLAALAAPAEVVALPAQPATGHLFITGRDSATITLDLLAGHVLARHGEPVALRPAPGAWSLLVRPSRELRDVTLWLEEPTTITAVQIDSVRYQRGAVIGAWSRESVSGTPATAPGAVVDAKALDALVEMLAAPRALGFIDEAVPVAHRVTLTITPPTGAPTGAPIEHVLALGAARAAGCPARLDRDTILLPATVCAQVAALAR